ncbi:glucose-6-phosphate isomerase [Rhodobacterales bacterium HKCCE3408]|nr:glucose-6-phosphate isomerase [Rhodobacterales bacterium HKCCE3408]
MTKTIVIAAALATSLLAGCQVTPQGQAGLAAAGGAAAGLLAARALDANPEWTLAAGLAGAAGGAALYQNQRTGQCAYPQGNGYYSVAPCP